MNISLADAYQLPMHRNPSDSAITNVCYELATECDGEVCGLTSYEGDVMPPVQAPHWHLVVTGKEPLAGPRLCPLWYEPVV